MSMQSVYELIERWLDEYAPELTEEAEAELLRIAAEADTRLEQYY